MMPSTAYARGLVNGAIEVAWWRYRLGRHDLDLPLAAIDERRAALRQLFLIRRELAAQPSSGGEQDDPLAWLTSGVGKEPQP